MSLLNISAFLPMAKARGYLRFFDGQRGTSSWNVVQDVVDTLNDAFYLSFDAIDPSGARFVLGLDVSGSMTSGSVGGMIGITPCIAAATMAMVTKRVEKHSVVMGFADQFRDLGISRNDTLGAASQKAQYWNFGSTDCALPITWALNNKIEADAFVIYTDNETNTFNSVKPFVALNKYRQKMGIDAKLVCVAMVPNYLTIADPTDIGVNY